MNKSKTYSPEVREWAVRMVFEHAHEHPSQWAAIQSIAEKIGCSGETLRNWVRQAERDQLPSVRFSTTESAESGMTANNMSAAEPCDHSSPTAARSAAAPTARSSDRWYRRVASCSHSTPILHFLNHPWETNSVESMISTL